MKVTPSQQNNVIVAKTTTKPKNPGKATQWWKASSDKQMCEEILGTVSFLKENQAYRQRQAALYARLYGNVSLFNFVGSNANKIDNSHSLPADRPTFNIVQSATDTLVSRISQNRPTPVFLTDNSDYKERNLAKKLNNFIQGELYQTRAYELGALILRDALVEGTGCVKIYEDASHKVALERVLLTELFIDLNEGIYGKPRQLHQIKLIDRAVLAQAFPGFNPLSSATSNSYPDDSGSSAKTVSDLVMVVESWHLPSGPDAKDGKHTIACEGGIILSEPWEKESFPFVFLHYSPRLLGFWAQGLAEQLMGTQVEINSLLYQISKAIKLVGVPRVFVEEGSKVTSASFNNDVGTIIKYKGVKPIYEVAPCVPEEMYAQLQRLIDYGYQQCGVSALQASSTKPAGLNSGEAIRSYDDISTDRFASLARRYVNFFIDLAYGIIDKAKEIAEVEGKYQTIYPHKNGTKEIDLPKMELLKNPFVIQCFDMSSLPRDPAGRMQKVTEMITSGMITIKEGRRLLDYPDLEQVERLANASEERIFQYLDEIVEEGDYNPPDSFMDLSLAEEITVQYINLYCSAKLEEEKADMLRTFFSQIQTLKQSAMSAMQQPAPQPGGPAGVPQQSVAPPPPTAGVNSAA